MEIYPRETREEGDREGEEKSMGPGARECEILKSEESGKMKIRDRAMEKERKKDRLSEKTMKEIETKERRIKESGR